MLGFSVGKPLDSILNGNIFRPVCTYYAIHNMWSVFNKIYFYSLGIPIRSVVVLEDEAHPAELQACHPRGESK